MRLLLYNIRYGIGLGASVHWPIPGAGYILGNRRNLEKITQFIREQDPDLVGLVEVDTGSLRTRRVNQAEEIARAIGHYSVFQCKYGASSFNHHLPIVRKQGNALLASPRVHGERFHYFKHGIKKLIIELELDGVAIFLVHLSLKYRHRQAQLHALHELVMESEKPAIIAGDFNTFWGEHELSMFMKATGLRSANPNSEPSYPSHAPRKELDFVLYSDGIRVKGFSIPKVRYSDHLPLICDFEVIASDKKRAA